MSRKGKKQVHLFLSDMDVAVLVDMEDRYGLNRSEIIRRLVRAAHGHGPMLTAEDSQKVVKLSHQLRKAGVNLYHLLSALRDGYAVTDEGGYEVWQGLHQRVLQLDQALTRMTESHGLKLRKSAGLEDRQPQATGNSEQDELGNGHAIQESELPGAGT
jgi:hypothetical protein